MFIKRAAIFMALMMAAVLLFANTSTAGAQQMLNKKWEQVWVHVGTEWKPAGAIGCGSIDGNPFGYVEHWRWYGGYVYDVKYNGRLVPVYGMFEGYTSPDLNAARDYVGPAEITNTQDYYTCWSY